MNIPSLVVLITVAIFSANAHSVVDEAKFVDLSERVAALEARIEELENREKRAPSEDNHRYYAYDLSQKQVHHNVKRPVLLNLPQEAKENDYSEKFTKNSKWYKEIEQKIRNLHDLVKWIDLRFTFVMQEIRQIRNIQRRSPKIVDEEESGSGGDDDYFFIVGGDDDSEGKLRMIVADLNHLREVVVRQTNSLSTYATTENLSELTSTVEEAVRDVSALKATIKANELGSLERDDALREQLEELEGAVKRTGSEMRQWMFVSEAMKLSHTKIFSALTEHSDRFAAMRARSDSLDLRLANLQVDLLNFTKKFHSHMPSSHVDNESFLRMQVDLGGIQNRLDAQSEKLEMTAIAVERKANSGTLEATNRDLRRVSDRLAAAENGVKYLNETLSLERTAVERLELELPRVCLNSTVARGHEKTFQLIKPSASLPSQFVRCDSGWTLIQERADGTVDFNRTFEEYRWPFGEVHGDHWAGNEYIHAVTNAANCSARFETWDLFGTYRVAFYRCISVADYSSQYRLNIWGYDAERSNLSDAMRFHDKRRFSSVDRDEDTSSTHCARYYAAGWWFANCMKANLNGKPELGIVWFDTSTNDWIHIRRTRIAVAPQIETADSAALRLIDDHRSASANSSGQQ